MRARPIVFRHECAPKQRRYPNKSKRFAETRRPSSRSGSPTPVRLKLRSDIAAIPVKTGVLPLPVDEVRRRRSIFRKTKVRGIFPHHHQLFGVFKRQRPQQHGIHCAEDYSICANAERDRNNSDARESRVLPPACAAHSVNPATGRQIC